MYSRIAIFATMLTGIPRSRANRTTAVRPRVRRGSLTDSGSGPCAFTPQMRRRSRRRVVPKLKLVQGL